MTAQISLFDEVPDRIDVPATAKPAVVYSDNNRANGHLLITTGPPRAMEDWLFENRGDVIRCCLPGWDTGVDLNAEQLRTLGEYCLEMADRIERRQSP